MHTRRLPTLILSLLAFPALAISGAACESALPSGPGSCVDTACDEPAGPDAGLPTVSGARMSPPAISLRVGEEVQMDVWLVDSNNRQVVAGSAPLYSTLDGLITVDNTGMLKAMEAGQTVVRATLDGYEVQADVIIATEEPTDDVEPEPEPEPIDPAVCCPGAVNSATDKNFCFLPPNTPGCPMTFGDGYCDEDDDQNYSTPDANYPECETDGTGCHMQGWIQGYDDAMAVCGDYNGEAEPPAPTQDATASCCALANDPNGPNDNICDVPPGAAECAPTQPGGYCDPNGDASYVDGDWNRGYNDYQALCN